MKALSLIFIAAVLGAILGTILKPARALASTTSELILGVGSSRDITVPRAGQIRISNSSVLTAQDLVSHLRLTGKKPGAAVVQTGEQSWSVAVLSAADWDSYRHLDRFLKIRRGLELNVHDGVVRVSGRLLRASDWRELALIEGLNYQFAADMDDGTARTLQAEVLQDLAHSQLPAPSLQLKPEAKVFLTQDQAALLPSYQKALSRWGFAVEINTTLVTLAPLVRVKILVTEIRKNFEQKLGLKWPGEMTAQVLPSWAAPVALEQGQISLEALESQGLGKVLASPNLLCRSGKQAEFLAGGEIPIKVTSFASQDVTWKQYGVKLKVSPVADSMGHMSIALTTEVSSIDKANSVEGIPALTTDRIESHFDLARTQTIALSGLIKKDTSESSDGLPWLSRLPILGALFSSRDYQNNQTELVVFVTPEVVHPEEGATL